MISTSLNIPRIYCLTRGGILVLEKLEDQRALV